MSSELTSNNPPGLAYETFRIWADFWSTKETFAKKVLPLVYYNKTSKDEVLIVAPCSAEELKLFLTSIESNPLISCTYETSEIGAEWIGHWSLFRVAPAVKS